MTARMHEPWVVPAVVCAVANAGWGGPVVQKGLVYATVFDLGLFFDISP